MVGVEATGIVVGKIEPGKFRPYSKGPFVLADTCLTVIINRQAKKSVLLKIEYEFGQALGGILKVVDLPASEEGERVKFIPFCEREIAIGLRIETRAVRPTIMSFSSTSTVSPL